MISRSFYCCVHTNKFFLVAFRDFRIDGPLRLDDCAHIARFSPSTLTFLIFSVSSFFLLVHYKCFIIYLCKDVYDQCRRACDSDIHLIGS